jgi:hypothetical protein
MEREHEQAGFEVVQLRAALHDDPKADKTHAVLVLKLEQRRVIAGF